MKLHCLVNDLSIVEVGVGYVDVAAVASISKTVNSSLSRVHYTCIHMAALVPV